MTGFQAKLERFESLADECELIAKRVQLLREMLPNTSRVAGLWQLREFGGDTTKEMLSEAEAAARTSGLQFQLVSVRGSDELEATFSAVAKNRPQALFVFPSQGLFLERHRIVDLSARYRLPAMYFAREFAATGGLMSYGPYRSDMFPRAATYVDKILKGTPPSDVPVEQPNKFELVINLKTAKALGLAIPPSVLLRLTK